MEGFGVLDELRNQQRPPRRNDKTYGKRKASNTAVRAMHLDLFGGNDENHPTDKIKEPEPSLEITDAMEKLTVENDTRKTPVQPDFEPEPVHQPPVKVEDSTIKSPRPRGRRKIMYAQPPTGRAAKRAAEAAKQLEAITPLLSLVEQDGTKDFQEFGRGIGKKYMCSKLGEGSYADVYELKGKNLEQQQELDKRGGLIIKVVPFRVRPIAKDDIADLDSITREIQLFQHVDALHGFVRCRGVHIVQGQYPDVLLEAFDAFKATHTDNTAINPDPRKTANSSLQLYAILEMNHAGSPLGNLQSASAFQVFDLFWKTAISLAHAERQMQFEHRDLHNGNICYKSRSEDGLIDVAPELIQEMDEKPNVILGLSNLEVTIIDYTLSRATIHTTNNVDQVIFDKMVYWDHEYEAQEGESEGEIRQVKTYAAVRELAIQAEEEAMEMGWRVEGFEYKAVDKYERFLPKSNVLWLKYVLADLLARGAGGRGACLPGSSRAAKRLQMELWRMLAEVEAYLEGTAMSLLPASADDFVGLAVEKGWLVEGDVAAYKAQMEEE